MAEDGKSVSIAHLSWQIEQLEKSQNAVQAQLAEIIKRITNGISTDVAVIKRELDDFDGVRVELRELRSLRKDVQDLERWKEAAMGWFWKMLAGGTGLGGVGGYAAWQALKDGSGG